MNRISRTAEVIGRTLIHFSFEPITFSLGVGALWVHKQLQATEVGHTVLHGAFDKIPGDHGFKSEGYTWQTPIDERSWHRGHNGRHHGATNVAGRDPDIHFGPVRLTEDTPWTKSHRLQLLYTLFVLFPNFGALMNLHFTGAVDLMQGNGREIELGAFLSPWEREALHADLAAARAAMPTPIKRPFSRPEKPGTVLSKATVCTLVAGCSKRPTGWWMLVPTCSV